ncbi:hypothetical protein [Streptomyces sp. H27-S2]|uniref:hypothetical protein n=1 Tax=Streptomyces antarcticus TaxID=2996458 RepID=UPI00226D7BA3|nr:hypothetical protein [Streptomyces sp. H27-S2]MCY0953853.1 hypothetical protein [Streptomyces sp. H27-S2]
MNLRSSWVAQTGQTREDTRLTQTGATTPVNPLQARSGILPGSYDGQYRLSGFWLEGTAAMAATLHEGRAVIQGMSGQGVYPVTLPGTVVLTFADGDAQAGRVDLVVLRVYDSSYDTSGKYEAVIEIVQGTPAAAPAAPAAPPLSLPLYQVAVPAGASAGKGGIPWGSGLTDLRSTTVGIGGILPVVGDTGKGSYPGQYQDAATSLQRWDGAAWVPYPSALGGIAPKGTLTTASYAGQYRDTPQRVLQRWNGSSWLSAFPAPLFAESRDAGFLTSATYTSALQDTGVTALTLAFTGPVSGAALLTLGARAWTTDTPGGYAYTSVRITQGSTVVWEPDDERAAIASGAFANSVSTVLRLSSLNGDAPYTATVMHRGSQATARTWFDSIFLRLDPLF